MRKVLNVQSLGLGMKLSRYNHQMISVQVVLVEEETVIRAHFTYQLSPLERFHKRISFLNFRISLLFLNFWDQNTSQFDVLILQGFPSVNNQGKESTLCFPVTLFDAVHNIFYFKFVIGEMLDSFVADHAAQQKYTPKCRKLPKMSTVQKPELTNCWWLHLI